MSARHVLLGGKVQLFRRSGTPYWYASASVASRQLKTSTKCIGLAEAKDFGEDWYLTLKGKERFGGGIPSGRTFKQTAEKFLAEFTTLTAGDRNAAYVAQFETKLRIYLVPFFGKKRLSEITPGLMQDYRVHRMTAPEDWVEPSTSEGDDQLRSGDLALKKRKRRWTKPSRTTLHHETVIMRQVLKYAHRFGWIDAIPDLRPPYKSSGKIVHRAWFSPNEYNALKDHTRRRASNPPHPKWKAECLRLHEYVLFMANTGLRPDECGHLEYRDVTVVRDDATGEKILEIEVRGKRGGRVLQKHARRGPSVRADEGAHLPETH